MFDGDLNRRVNKYHDLLENATHKKPIKISEDALFFIPEFGGFNTNKLARSKESTPVKMTSIQFYTDVLLPAYQRYKDAGGMKGIDDWLQEYYENYTQFKQK